MLVNVVHLQISTRHASRRIASYFVHPQEVAFDDGDTKVTMVTGIAMDISFFDVTEPYFVSFAAEICDFNNAQASRRYTGQEE